MCVCAGGVGVRKTGPKQSIYAQFTGLSLTLLVFGRNNFFKTSESYIYMDDNFSFNDISRVTAVKCMRNVGEMGSFKFFL